MRIFLIGFMGSGKTTIGKQLASKLGYQFIDQDDYIEKRFGMSIDNFFATYGEPKFRETERDVVKEMGGLDNVVVSTGGGTPCFFDNVQSMNEAGVSIYIKVDSKTLANRLKNSRIERPLIKGKTGEELLQFITDKLNEREKYYNQAKITMQSSNLKVDDILLALGQHSKSNS